MAIYFSDGTALGIPTNSGAFNPTTKGEALGFTKKKKKQNSFGDDTGLGLIGDLIGGVADPFVETGYQIAEYGNKAAERFRANQEGREFDENGYQAKYMDPEQYQDYQKNGGLRTLQNVAGLASFAVPGGSALKAAGGGALQGFSSTRGTREDGTADVGAAISGALGGAALGGATSKAMDIGGNILKKIGSKGAGKVAETGSTKVSKALNEFADGRDLNVIKRAVGSPAPKNLGGAQFEKEVLGLAGNLGFKINSADDLLSMSDDILAKNGNKVADDAARLSKQGVKFDSGKVVNRLNKMLDEAKLPSDKAQIQKVIDDIQGGLAQGDDLLSAYRLKQQIGPKGKFSSQFDPNLKPQFEAYNAAYKELNDELENQFVKSGIKDFRQTNKLNELGLKARQWAEGANAKVRPTASVNDMLQDSAIAGMVATGNPVGAIPGAVAGKVMQSTAFEKGLGKAARGAANIIDNGLSGLPSNVPGASAAGNILSRIGTSRVPGLVAGQMAQAEQANQQPIQTGQQQSSTPQLPKTQYDEIINLVKSGMSPKDAQAFLAQLNGGQSNGKTKPLSTEERKLQSNVRAGLKAVDDIENILNSDQGALISGQLPGIVQSPNARKLNTAISQAVDVIGRLRSGGAIGEEEEKRFRDFLPQPFDDPETKAYKISSLRDALSEALTTRDLTSEVI